jgi:hypothetical protein
MIGYVLTVWSWISKLVSWKKLSKKVSGWCSWEVVAIGASAGFLLCVYFLVRENMQLKSAVEQTKQLQATEKARYKSDLDAKEMAYKNQAVVLKAFQTRLNSIDCNGEWSEETAPDGTVKIRCSGVMSQSTSSTTASESATAPIFAPPVLPSAAMNCPEIVRQWGSVLLGAGHCGGWGPVVGVRVMRVSILGGAVFADKVRPGALATVDVYRF